MSMRSIGIAIVAVLLLPGCTSAQPWVGRQAQALGGAKGAVLVNAEDSPVWILTLDGERLGVPPRGEYRLAPGPHTARVQYFWTRGDVTWTGNELVDYAFDAKEEAQLKVVCQHTQEPRYKGTWTFWIEDAGTREVVASEASRAIVARGATGERREPPFAKRLPFVVLP